MNVLATVVTPGFVGNPLVEWLLNQGNLRFCLIEAKPRERSKMEALRTFLDSDAEWWLMLNHYASPQFEMAHVPFDRSVFSASMMRPAGVQVEEIRGKEIRRDGQFMQTDFIGTGCLFMRRDVAETIADTRPFEYQHDALGNCTKSADATMSDRIIQAGHGLWVWDKRCLNRQEIFV